VRRALQEALRRGHGGRDVLGDAPHRGVGIAQHRPCGGHQPTILLHALRTVGLASRRARDREDAALDTA
jgi:hypothetical protein